MSDAYDAIEPNRLAHLQMIQSIISRLANEASLMRGAALTVSAAFFGFAASETDWRLAALGLLPALAFWWLNAYYLRSERRYRKLYDRVRQCDKEIPAFSMDASKQKTASLSRMAVSSSLLPFYGSIIGVGLILITALCSQTRPGL